MNLRFMNSPQKNTICDLIICLTPQLGATGTVDLARFFSVKVEIQREKFVSDTYTSHPNEMGLIVFSLRIKSNDFI